MPLLFSYGTLQDETVQRQTFGRRLASEKDELIGFVPSLIELDDPAFVAKSGKAHHAIVTFTGDPTHRVRGTVLELTEAELMSADRYEPAPYQRVGATFASGRQGFVYAARPPEAA